MKVTVYPREKATFRAVAWYAKYVSPMGVDAYVDSIGDDTLSLSIDKKVFIAGGLSVTPVRIGEPIGGFNREIEVYTELVIESPYETDIVRFIEKAKSEYEKKCTEVERDPKFVKVMTWDGCYWSSEYKTPSRTKGTVYVPEMKGLLDDLQSFYSNSERYLELEIPYARTYMLHGLPGTGKTSMIYTVASEFKKNLAIIDFSDREVHGGRSRGSQSPRCLT